MAATEWTWDPRDILIQNFSYYENQNSRSLTPPFHKYPTGSISIIYIVYGYNLYERFEN